MTANQRVFQALKSVGIPGTKVAWEDGHAPAIPWFTYGRNNKASGHKTKRGWLKADDVNYAEFPRYYACLYMKENDPELLSAFTDAVSSLDGAFDPKSESWLQSEGCWEYRFEFTLLPERKED